MTNLSNRQYPLLKLFIDANHADYHMTADEAATLDQRPFRSLLMRGWLSYKRGSGFYLTKDGRAAWDEFQSTSILRANTHAPLCGWFYEHFAPAQPEARPARPARGKRAVARYQPRNRHSPPLPGLDPGSAPARPLR